ncbi:hypothetical protein [Paraconexibacter algicola]|uniref:hypothetical protein n=1 Tax=Paraconexibacter algicola TaxID=2133960 RepID=UPI0011B23D6B|nr:hypothetical protein [Paraconexibacter algicola]
MSLPRSVLLLALCGGAAAALAQRRRGLRDERPSPAGPPPAPSPAPARGPRPAPQPGTSGDDARRDETLEQSFPASDPPASY